MGFKNNWFININANITLHYIRLCERNIVEIVALIFFPFPRPSFDSALDDMGRKKAK